MTAPRVATWILELVTSPDRATAIVGDFLEESKEHGRFWFWRQIAQTLLGHVTREFKSAPFRLLLCLPASVLLYAITLFLWMGVLRWIYPHWYTFYYTVFTTPQDGSPGFPGQEVVILTIIAVVHLRGGWDLARATQRPLAASVMFAMGFALTWSFVELNHVRQVHIFGIQQVLVFIGAIWQRRRSLRTA